MTKLIILDRDGVINYLNLNYVRNREQLILMPSSLLAIAKLCEAGYTISVATNQSGIARGYYTEKDLHDIHEKMNESLAEIGATIDTIFYCPHHPDENCLCRKPKPGMLYKIRDHYKVDLSCVPFVGDRDTDVEAAFNAGAKPVLLGRDYDTLASYVDAFLS